ncbi:MULTISPECIES: DUF2300 domain-containing protein [unclassified Cupriavidus]|uniref:DUF2300 domain-containing protein n=1 Tax=unclassified Cupriavidus TaxID=2640874 RepID=UPI003F8E5302
MAARCLGRCATVLAALCWAASALALAAADGAQPLHFARLAGTEAQLYRLGGATSGAMPAPLPPGLQTPLGSVWKLFVYSYLVGRDKAGDDYTCRGGDPEEVYCCTAGQSIDREHALVQSCGRYFEPLRLGLSGADWRRFWKDAGAPAWLQDMRAMQPGRVVPVAELLAALHAVPPAARQAASATLVSVLTVGRGEGTLASYGSLLRAKTWTMPDPVRPGASIGGAAGWLADGSPAWLGGQGASANVLRRAAPLLQPLLATVPVPDDGACVLVDMFERHALRELLGAGPERKAVPDGPLNGTFRAEFANGNSLRVDSRGELSLVRAAGAAPRVVGRFGLNDYVARVVEREGDTAEPEAARALAVAVRSYLVQQAAREQGCFRIADSSRTQRVLPRTPTAAARRAADQTDGLVLSGVAVRYHHDAGGPGRMAWTEARRAAGQGQAFDTILARWWPQATLTSFQSPVAGDCLAIANARQWLAQRAPQWQRRLGAEPGYEAPPLPAVCEVREGRPYADARRNRLYIHRLASEDDRIALAHEYLHLAFARHPRGQDEQFVEGLARKLVRTENPS